MASVRRRPSSSVRNPFDSSDDENDDRKPAPSSRSYVNPFDDDHGSDCKAKSNPPPHRSMPPAQAQVKNPFDGENEEEEGGAQKDDGMKQKGLKAKLDQGTLFDEEPRFHGYIDNISECKPGSKSTATIAFKKVQKFKDAGASQASKMVEGGIYQTQRLKESSFNAFKSSEGKTNPSVQERNLGHAENMNLRELKKDVYAGRLDDLSASGGHPRSQLFADEARTSALNMGESYEMGFLRMSTRTRYDDRQFQGADLEQRSVQELEGYAVQKSEDTTKHIQNCLKVAEDIKGDANHTLISLHQQGEQLRRTHEVAYDIEQNLTAGEKLLGSLGGMFSRTWKPKRSSAIRGPIDEPKDFQIQSKGHHLEQRNALGLDSKGHPEHAKRPSYDVFDSQSQTTEAKLKMERMKQDDALSDLSNVLDQLKEMSIDMGNEIARQNVSLEHFQNDVVVLNDRTRGANARGRRLLGK